MLVQLTDETTGRTWVMTERAYKEAYRAMHRIFANVRYILDDRPSLPAGDPATTIVPRPSAAADDALGVPRAWRDRHHD